MKSTLRYPLLAALLLSACGAWPAGCGGSAAQAKDGPRTRPRPSRWRPPPPSKAAVAATYSGTTTLEAAEEASVVAKVGGTVSEIYAEEGRQVKAGDALAKLDDADMRYTAEQAEANYDKKQLEFAAVRRSTTAS